MAHYQIKLLNLWNDEVFPSFEARETEPLYIWSNKHFRLTKSSGGEGVFEAFPYQEGLMTLMSMVGLEKLVVFKCSQIGYTQMLLAWYCYEVAHRARSVIIWQPTDGDAKDFATTQLGSVLEVCKTVAAEMVVNRSDKKDPANTTHKKEFKNAIGYTLGAKSANAFRRRSAPSLGLDELDAMDSDVEGDGRIDKLAASRSGGVSTFIKLIMGSTPTISGTSNIEMMSNEIDVELRRYYPCPHCGTEQVLSFGDKTTSHGMKWDGTLETNLEKAESCYYSCQGCDEPILYSSLYEMDKKAIWKCVDNDLWLDVPNQCFRSIETDDVVKTPLEATVYLNSFMSYTYEWWRTTLEFLNAIDQLRAGDNSALVTWTNHRAGECFHDVAEKQVKGSVLFERTKSESYSINALPEQAEYVVGAADIQGDRIEYAFYAFGYGEESWCIDYYKVQGNPAATDVLQSMKKDSERTFHTKDGRQLKCELVCVDSGYLPQTVYDFCSHEPHKFIPIKGSNQIGAVDVLWPKKHTEGTYRVRLGTQALKDTLSARFKFEEVGAGYQHWPNRPEMFSEEDYFKQMTAEFKRLKRIDNKTVRVWETAHKGVRNEAWDIQVYALAAIRILQRYYRKEFTIPSDDAIESRKAQHTGRIPVQHVQMGQQPHNPNGLNLQDVLNKMAG